jgi:hypothetical protein
MNSRELEFALAKFGASASQLDKVTRSLREAIVVPTGARGINAPSLDDWKAAWIIVGLAGSDIASRAAENVLRIQALVNQERTCDRELIGAMVAIIGDLESASKVDEVRICRNFPLATIVWKSGKVERFVGPDVPADEVAVFDAVSFRIEGVLSGGLLEVIAKEIAKTSKQAAE